MQNPKYSKTSRDITTRTGPFVQEVTIPTGTRVQFLPDPSGGRWVLDAFPEKAFPINSIERHDAIHHGVTIKPEDIEGLTECPTTSPK